MCSFSWGDKVSPVSVTSFRIAGAAKPPVRLKRMCMACLRCVNWARRASKGPSLARRAGADWRSLLALAVSVLRSQSLDQPVRELLELFFQLNAIRVHDLPGGGPAGRDTSRHRHLDADPGPAVTDRLLLVTAATVDIASHLVGEIRGVLETGFRLQAVQGSVQDRPGRLPVLPAQPRGPLVAS